MEVVHLNQKQLAARWSISEATLELLWAVRRRCISWSSRPNRQRVRASSAPDPRSPATRCRRRPRPAQQADLSERGPRSVGTSSAAGAETRSVRISPPGPAAFRAMKVRGCVVTAPRSVWVKVRRVIAPRRCHASRAPSRVPSPHRSRGQPGRYCTLFTGCTSSAAAASRASRCLMKSTSSCSRLRDGPFSPVP